MLNQAQIYMDFILMEQDGIVKTSVSNNLKIENYFQFVQKFTLNLKRPYQ